MFMLSFYGSPTFNRPGVAGCIQQTPLSLFHWIIDSVILLFRIFNTGVRCQVSGVRCQVSGVKCNIIFLFFFGQSGGASRVRIFYRRGLPRLVFRWRKKTWELKKQCLLILTHVSNKCYRFDFSKCSKILCDDFQGCQEKTF